MPARLPPVRLLHLTPCAVLLQGCAAILGSKSTNVAAVSQPPGAEVYLDGARVGVTPDTISVESKRSHTMVLRLPGYKEDSCVLASSADAGWIILDVLLGGLVGVIVDAATGEWNELTRKSCNVVLTPADGADPAVVAAEARRDPAAAARPLVQPFRSSAPDEIVSDRVKAERRRAVGDMLRLGLVTAVEQGPLGVLRVGVGEKFHSHQAREYYFTQLEVAYHSWRIDSHPLIVELWQSGRKIGEYTDRTFSIGPRYTTPLDCPDTATTGLCNSLGESVRQDTLPASAARGETAVPAPQTTADGRPAPVPARPGSAANARERSGFHFGLGLGGGTKDLACDGCDFPSETGFSGFLSLAGSVGEKTLVGVESTGWTKSQSGTTARVYSLTANVTEYLSTTNGLFLSAGLGVVGYHEDRDSGDRSANAVGFSGRVGYELGTGGLVFVPYVGLVRTFGGADVKSDGENVGLNVAISNLQFGLGIAAH